MLQTELRIIDWAARTDHRETKAEWCAWAGGKPPLVAAAERPAMPMMLRRRLGRIGQLAVGAANETGPDRSTRYLFCSRHGDLRRTALLLSSLAAKEPLSPAEFSVSVHNAFAGLLSIAMNATAGHTAIAAGPDSFAFGLVEALACLRAAPEQKLLLVYYDEDPPPPYDELPTETGDGIALALLLSGGGEAQGERVGITLDFRGDGETAETTRQAFECVRFLASGEGFRRSSGGRVDVEWRRVA